MKKLINSFRHATEGIINTATVETNLQIHITVMICVVLMGLMVGLTMFEWIICIILFGLVISAELFNTALEETLDYINEEYNEKIRFIKDASAGAVLVTAIVSIIVGLIIFIPKFV